MLKKNIIKRNKRQNLIRSEQGAAILAILIVSTIVAVMLTTLLTWVKSQREQINRMGLRQTAERLNRSAFQTVSVLWTTNVLQPCKLGTIPVNGEQKTITGVNINTNEFPNLAQGGVRVTSQINKPNIQERIPTITLRLCGGGVQDDCDANTQTTVQMYTTINPNRPANCDGCIQEFVWLLNVKTTVNNGIGRAITRSSDYLTNLYVRRAGLDPLPNCDI